ncbi:hypothetical protein MRX96_007083 [Rhipicephalus microplus]
MVCPGGSCAARRSLFLPAGKSRAQAGAKRERARRREMAPNNLQHRSAEGTVSSCGRSTAQADPSIIAFLCARCVGRLPSGGNLWPNGSSRKRSRSGACKKKATRKKIIIITKPIACRRSGAGICAKDRLQHSGGHAARYAFLAEDTSNDYRLPAFALNTHEQQATAILLTRPSPWWVAANAQEHCKHVLFSQLANSWNHT